MQIDIFKRAWKPKAFALGFFAYYGAVANIFNINVQRRISYVAHVR